MYVLRIQQPDGSWKFDMDTPMSKREADFESKRNRIWLGVLCQVWKEKEAAGIVAAYSKDLETDSNAMQMIALEPM